MNGLRRQATPRSGAGGRGPAVLGALALGALAAVAYSPYVLAAYGYCDDYLSLWTIGGPGLGEAPLMVLRGGRLLYAVLYDFAFGLCRGIADLRFLRAIAAVGAVVTGLLVADAVARRGAARAEAWLVGAGVALLPAMTVLVSWASAFAFPWAAAGAVLAGALWARARAHASTGDRRGARLTGAAAFLLLLATLHLYQPAAQFWFVPLAAAIAFAPAGGQRAALREAVLGAALFAAAGVLHLAIARAFVALFLGGPIHERARLLDPAALPEHLRWYFELALPNALRVFVVDRRLAPALLVAAIALAGLALRFHRRGGSVPLGLAACAALLPLAYTANLVTAQRWAALRTVGAAAAIAWLFAVAGAVELAARPGRSGRFARRAVLAVLGAVVLAQAIQIRARLAPLVVDVQLREMAAVRARVAELIAGGHGAVVFRRAHWSDSWLQPLLYDEIAMPSTSAAWVPEGMLNVFHRERTGVDFPGEVTVIGPDEPLAGDGFRIDMRAEYERIRYALRLPGAARPKAAT